MAGGLTISTLNDSSGVLATQNGMKGICKAWVNFNGISGAAIRDSFNCSSITRLGSASYQFNFATAMPSANYVPLGSCCTNTAAAPQYVTPYWRNYTNTSPITPTTGYFEFSTSTPSGGGYEETYVHVAVFSS